MEKEKTVYFKNLDGLRAIAAFSVLFFHTCHWFKIPNNSNTYYLLTFGKSGGILGVQFFLILSGFLITYLMFIEHTLNKKINIIKFYFRRLLRVWPLYYLTLFIGFFAYPLILKTFTGITYSEDASLFLYSIFAVNFDHIYNKFPTIGILGVHWSVAIEEQFYLIWPLIFSLFIKTKKFPLFLIILILYSEIFYIQNINSYTGYYHFISNVRFLAFGAIIAYLCFFKLKLTENILQKISKKMNLLIYIGCILLMFFQSILLEKSHYFSFIIEIIPTFFFSYVILDQNFSNTSFFKLGEIKVLNWLGKISYGIYLYHMIAIYFVINLIPMKKETIPLQLLITIILTILISYLSHKYFESFFINIKKKFSYQSSIS